MSNLRSHVTTDNSSRDSVSIVFFTDQMRPEKKAADIQGGFSQADFHKISRDFCGFFALILLSHQKQQTSTIVCAAWGESFHCGETTWSEVFRMFFFFHCFFLDLHLFGEEIKSQIAAEAATDRRSFPNVSCMYSRIDKFLFGKLDSCVGCWVNFRYPQGDCLWTGSSASCNLYTFMWTNQNTGSSHLIRKSNTK